MSAVVNNTMAATGTGGALAVTVSTIDSLGIIAGDVIVAQGTSNGTHVANGMTFQDSVNLVNFTVGKEQQLGGASAIWQQVNWYVAAANVPDGSTITLTPFAAATVTGLAVTVIRFSKGTIAQAFVSQGNTASFTQNAPALGGIPVLGSFVMTFDAAANTGTLTPGAGWTLDSNVFSSGVTLGNAWNQADGIGTFASTWTDSASNVSATQTVAFTLAGVGVPYSFGQVSQAAGAAATTVCNVSTTTIANDGLFVIIGNGSSNTVTPVSIADSKGHTWTQVASATTASQDVWVYQSLNAATPLVGGVDTVTVTWTASGYAKNVQLIGCAGINHTTALDQFASVVGGPNNSVGVTTSNALANNNELALGVVGAGSASQGVTFAPGWTDVTAGGLHNAASVYMAVGTQVISGKTTPVNLSAALGASSVWTGLVVMLLPDPPTAAAATLTITTNSPLPTGTVGVAYSTPLAATGGVPNYTWSIASGGPLQAGLQLNLGGGTTTPIARAGFTANSFSVAGTGADVPGLTAANWAADFAKYFGNAAKNGSGLCAKMFFHLGLPSTWAATSGTTAPAADIAAQFPGFTPMICWNNTPSASGSEITAFCNSIPLNQVCAFSWQQEMEGGGITSSFFQSNWRIIYNAVRASSRSANMWVVPSSRMDYYQNGGDTAFIVPSNFADAYGADVYYFLGGTNTPPATGLQDLGKYQNWLTQMQKINGNQRPLTLSEYGISIVTQDPVSGTLVPLRARYIHNDINWINAQFNNPTGVSPYPLWFWMYWDRWTKQPSAPEYGPLRDSTAIAEWKGAMVQAQTGSGGSGGQAGLIHGVPTASGTVTPTFRVTDSVGNTQTKALSLTINPTTALAWVTPPGLPGGTVNTPYSLLLQGSGGTLPYTFSVNTGSVLPTGLSLTGTGSNTLSGTPTVSGNFSFTLKLTDAVPNSVLLACTLTLAGGLSITTTSLPPGQVNVPYTFTLGTANGTSPFAWTLGAGSQDLPSGLVLDPAAGTISGTPLIPASAQMIFQVMDGANAVAVSNQMLLTIASSGGGLPPIGRRRFGGTASDWVFQFFGDAVDRGAGVTVTFYTAISGGTQVTDLQDTGGNGITSVLTDSNGQIPEFFGPAGTTEMYADANGGLGPRRRVVCADLGDLLVTLYTVVQGLTG